MIFFRLWYYPDGESDEGDFVLFEVWEQRLIRDDEEIDIIQSDLNQDGHVWVEALGLDLSKPWQAIGTLTVSQEDYKLKITEVEPLSYSLYYDVRG